MTQSELDSIIQSGEGYKTEFKRSVNSDLSRELVALANSSGGRVLIGVEDNGKISGAALDNKMRSQIETIANDCDPSVKISLTSIGPVIIITVPEGKRKPYRCTNGFYIRNGATTLKLTTQEIVDFIKTEGRIKFDELQAEGFTYPEGFDQDVLKTFFGHANISVLNNIDDLLENLGVLIREDGTAVNNTGVLFFSKHPANIIPQSAVVCVVYQGNSKVDILDKKTFDFDMITNIDESINFLKRHLNVAFEIKGSRRSEKLEIPEIVLREAVVNAVTHRDYFEKGAHVMIEIFENRVEISNPGGLPKGLKPEQFGTKTLARNPLIADLLNRARYIEKLGTGIPRIRQKMQEADLPEPVFEFDGFFTIRLKRYDFANGLMTELDVSAKKADRMVLLLNDLYQAKPLNIETLATLLATTSRTLRNDLETLIEIGWVKSIGATKGRDYEITELGRQKLARFL